MAYPCCHGNAVHKTMIFKPYISRLIITVHIPTVVMASTLGFFIKYILLIWLLS